MLGTQVKLDLENKLDQLTTKADSFYTMLEDKGRIVDDASLLSFLDELVEFLEGTMGGKVESIHYQDDRHLEIPGFRRQRANFGTALAMSDLVKEIILQPSSMKWRG